MVNILASKDSFKFRIVELILLAMLKNEDKYGYQISQEVSDLSNGYLYLKEGSMYPVLYKLMEKGYIKSRTEKIGEKRTRVYYHLEDSGREYLKETKSNYINNVKIICKIAEISKDELFSSET